MQGSGAISNRHEYREIGARMGLRARACILLLVAMVACGRSARESALDGAPAAPSTDWEVAREAARAVLETHCSECHDPGSPGALPRALRVFDLAAPDWSAHMSRS